MVHDVLINQSCICVTSYQNQGASGGRAAGSGRRELTTVGPQHVDHSPRRAHDDLGSSLQLSNLDTTGAQ